MKGHGTNILIVDDDDVAVMAVRRAANALNLEMPTLRARDGREALEMLRDPETYGVQWPCVLLLDINMPRMTGLELLAELREDNNLCRAVVFMMTTSDDPNDISAAYAHKVAGYIVKGEGQLMLRKTLEMLDIYDDVITPSPPPVSGNADRRLDQTQ